MLYRLDGIVTFFAVFVLSIADTVSVPVRHLNVYEVNLDPVSIF